MDEQTLVEQIELGEMIATSALDDRYGIKKPSRNDRLAHLRMKGYRKGKLFYLTTEQVEILDRFDEHIKENGTFEGFLLPAPTGPWGEDEPEEETAIAPVEQNGIATAEPSPNAANLIAPQAPGAAGYTAINPDRMMQQALTMATEGLMAQATAENLVNNPHLLPLHLQQQVMQYSNGLKRGIPQPTNPKPEDLAAQVLERFQGL